MTTPAGTVRAWGARSLIAATIHIPHFTEAEAVAAVEARLQAAEDAAIAALTDGLPGAYADKPEHAVTVTALQMKTPGRAI